MFFHFEGFTRRCRHATTWSCEGIHDVQHQHSRQSPKGELLPFEPSSHTHIGWVILSLLSSSCLHDTWREDLHWRWTFKMRSARTYWMHLRTFTHATTSSIGISKLLWHIAPKPSYLLIVCSYAMLHGQIIPMTNLHLMHGLTHNMVASLHRVFPCHP